MEDADRRNSRRKATPGVNTPGIAVRWLFCNFGQKSNMRLLFVAAFLFSFPAFSQLKKPVPPVYKTIASQTFAVGDRIAMGEVRSELLPVKYRKYSVSFNDSMQLFRDFMFAHPNLEFRVNVLWQQSGRKFPGETEVMKDTLENYFRKPADSGNNKLFANQVRHSYHKQPEHVKLELEVIAVKATAVSSMYAFVSAVPAFPDDFTVYEKYDNHIVFGVPGLAESEALWIEAAGVTIKYLKRGEAIVHTRLWAGDELMVSLRSGTAEHPVNHGNYWLRVQQLPEPQIFLGPVKLEDLPALTDSLAFGYRAFSAQYPREIPLIATFPITEIYYTIAGKECKQTGSELSAKVLKKIEAAEKGTDIVITKVVVNGPRRFKIKKDVRKVKSTPAGTYFKEIDQVVVDGL